MHIHVLVQWWIIIIKYFDSQLSTSFLYQSNKLSMIQLYMCWYTQTNRHVHHRQTNMSTKDKQTCSRQTDMSMINKLPLLLTLLPSMSKWEKLRVMRYWSGATICHTQFLLGGYRSGKEGLWMVPAAWSMYPPQASESSHQNLINHWPYPFWIPFTQGTSTHVVNNILWKTHKVLIR